MAKEDQNGGVKSNDNGEVITYWEALKMDAGGSKDWQKLGVLTKKSSGSGELCVSGFTSVAGRDSSSLRFKTQLLKSREPESQPTGVGETSKRAYNRN